MGLKRERYSLFAYLRLELMAGAHENAFVRDAHHARLAEIDNELKRVNDATRAFFGGTDSRTLTKNVADALHKAKSNDKLQTYNTMNEEIDSAINEQIAMLKQINDMQVHADIPKTSAIYLEH